MSCDCEGYAEHIWVTIGEEFSEGDSGANVTLLRYAGGFSPELTGPDFVWDGKVYDYHDAVEGTATGKVVFAVLDKVAGKYVVIPLPEGSASATLPPWVAGQDGSYNSTSSLGAQIAISLASASGGDSGDSEIGIAWSGAAPTLLTFTDTGRNYRFDIRGDGIVSTALWGLSAINMQRDAGGGFANYHAEQYSPMAQYTATDAWGAFCASWHYENSTSGHTIRFTGQLDAATAGWTSVGWRIEEWMVTEIKAY